MQAINLANECRVAILDSIGIDIKNIDALDWETKSLPLDDNFIGNLSSTDRVWLQCAFMMPINEECSTWWLETDIVLHGRVWLNDNAVDNPEKNEIFQLEVTNYMALDENIIIFCLEPTADLKDWREVACVPYPCT